MLEKNPLVVGELMFVNTEFRFRSVSLSWSIFDDIMERKPATLFQAKSDRNVLQATRLILNFQLTYSI